MPVINWLHLSDWHEGSRPFEHDEDRIELRKRLLADIHDRTDIDRRLSHINFIVISGDIANAGSRQEYQDAQNTLINPLLDTCGLQDAQTSKVFICPGNHDLDWKQLGAVPNELWEPLLYNKPSELRRNVANLLSTRPKRDTLLLPFQSFSEFKKRISPPGCFPDDQAAFYSVHHLAIQGTKIGVICLNSAWLSGRNCNAAGKIIDYGQLCVGQTQIRAAFDELHLSDLVICVLHHPLSWLAEFDRNTSQELLFKECHFILHGHEHLPQIRVTESTLGDVIVIPSGATYGDDA